MLLACTTEYVDADDDEGDGSHDIAPTTVGSGGATAGVGAAGPGTGTGTGGASATTGSGSGGAPSTTTTTGPGGSGGAGGGGPTDPPCEVLAAELCARSCDCTMNDADPRCRYLYDGPHPDGGNTIQMRTQEIQTCAQDLAVDLCGDTTKTEQELNYCISQLDAGMCVIPAFAGGKHAYEVTIDCFTVFECEAGPCLQ